MLMAILSLLCSLMVFVLIWAILPIFIFGPLGIYFGWKSYRRVTAGRPVGPLRRLLALLPMGIAIAVIPLALALVDAGYRA